jgi:hypothetical protein
MTSKHSPQRSHWPAIPTGVSRGGSYSNVGMPQEERSLHTRAAGNKAFCGQEHHKTQEQHIHVHAGVPWIMFASMPTTQQIP